MLKYLKESDVTRRVTTTPQKPRDKPRIRNPELYRGQEFAFQSHVRGESRLFPHLSVKLGRWSRDSWWNLAEEHDSPSHRWLDTPRNALIYRAVSKDLPPNLRSRTNSHPQRWNKGRFTMAKGMEAWEFHTGETSGFTSFSCIRYLVQFGESPSLHTPVKWVGRDWG